MSRACSRLQGLDDSLNEISLYLFPIVVTMCTMYLVVSFVSLSKYTFF